MFTRELFDKAMLFYGAKIYRKFYSEQIIGLRLSDGSDAYISVMGSSSGYISLAVYPGEEGLHSLLRLVKNLKGEDGILSGLTQHSVQCVFEPRNEMPDESYRAVNGLLKQLNITVTDRTILPSFSRYEPFRLDCPGRQEDYRMLEEAFDAVLYLDRLDKKGQFSIAALPQLKSYSGSRLAYMVKDGDGYRLSAIETQPFDESMLPEAELPEEAILQQAAALPVSPLENFDVSLAFVSPIADKDSCSRIVPQLLLCLNRHTGKLLHLDIGKDDVWGLEYQLEVLVKRMLKRKKKPAAIYTNSIFTHHLLKPLCERLEISLVFDDNLRSLTHALFSMHQHFIIGDPAGRRGLS